MADHLGFENIASAYAASVDTKPLHIYYERPNLWSLLPKTLNGKQVLDIGCGSGWYAEQLQKSGAHVTALDASPTMVELTKKRLHHKGQFYIADLEQPLIFLEANVFDIIIAPLVIHYIQDWHVFFKRLSTTLKPNGLFIFSTHQPQTEVEIFGLKNYFDKTLITDNWPHIGEVKFYHHTLHELGEALFESNFVIERLLEPQPLPEMAKADPEMFANIIQKPWLLFVRAKKID